MQHSSALPYELRYFDTYKKAMRHHEEYIVYNRAARSSISPEGAISPLFNTFVAAAEEANSNAIERLSTYGHEFLETYVEPLLQDTEESLNLLMGLTTQYEYRDTCHREEWDWRHYRESKDNIATLTIGITANRSLRKQESHSPENTIAFDELHHLIKQMWSNYAELIKLANRLSDMVTCFENWRNNHNNNP